MRADELENVHSEHVATESSNHVPLVDSGVSHHFCGNFQLFSNFKLFARPIPLKIATSNGSAYITGEGNLTFHGADKKMVTIHGGLYCDISCSTLISLAALQKANALFAYDMAQEFLNIYSKNFILVFHCLFVANQNK